MSPRDSGRGREDAVMMVLGLEPETLARMAILGSRVRLEAYYREIVKTRIMNDGVRRDGLRRMTIEEAVDEWRPEILEGDGTVQP